MQLNIVRVNQSRNRVRRARQLPWELDAGRPGPDWSGELPSKTRWTIFDEFVFGRILFIFFL